MHFFKEALLQTCGQKTLKRVTGTTAKYWVPMQVEPVEKIEMSYLEIPR